MTEVYAKIKELREEHNEAHNKWWENEQAFRAWRDKDKARKCVLIQSLLNLCWVCVYSSCSLP